ncbi:MAG: YadA-like family protein [Phascolarctobacterium sp.]|nr:YadA-like family protein [Phascolarctobacterium sp.]
MKKNLAKRIVLGLLTGAVFMSSSVAWAADLTIGTHTGTNSILITMESGHAYMDNSIFIGNNGGVGQMNGGVITEDSGKNGVAIGEKAKVIANDGVALGADTTVSTVGSVALGYGSVASESNVVSVGSGDENQNYGYRKIVNVANGDIESADSHEAVTGGQLYEVKTSIGATIGTVDYHGENSVIPDATNTLTGAISVLSVVAKSNLDKIGSGELGYQYANYISGKDLTEAALELDERVKANADAITNANSNLVKKDQDNVMSGSVTINDGGNSNNPIVMDNDGITVGKNSTRMDGKGFYVWADGLNNTNRPHNIADAIASMNDEGEIKGVNGIFSGNVTATKLYIDKGNGSTIDVENELDKKADTSYVDSELTKKADQTALVAEKTAREQGDQNLQSQIDKIGGGAIAGINQRLEKTNAKINKVGAGAAALAALHPLDYDPDDKLTFSAGMGNYAGENAAALGAFYRPNEKFMLSLGGTMGNGENMVNLGLSIGLDKPNGFAKMSKRELIQEVNAVKAENEAMKDQLANADERIAKLEALVAQLVAK